MTSCHQTSQISGTMSIKTNYFTGHKVLPSSCLLVTSCGRTKRRFTNTTDKQKENISTKLQLNNVKQIQHYNS